MLKTHLQPESFLFVPANRIERFEKALATAAHAIIIDLEDAVPIELKISARENLKVWLKTHPQHQIMLRVNAQSTQWFQDDLALALLPNVSAVILPKTESAAELTEIQKVLQDYHTGIHPIAVYPLIETPLGLANVRAIAQTEHVIALMFGSIDFQLEMNMQGGFAELMSFRNEIVLASRLANIAAPIDGVTVDFQDKSIIQQETWEAKNLGFGGKLCIHPNQVSLVNQVFQPSESEITWAQRVMDVVEQSQGQAVSLDGKMIDLPVILKAKKILQRVQPNQTIQ